LSAFADCEVEYLLVGAHALAVHGVVRATADLDVWVRPSPGNAARVRRALLAFGAPADRFDEADLVQPDSVLQFGVAPVRIDVLTGVSGVAFDEAWPDRVVVQIEGLAVPVLGRAHLLANKRATGRPRDRLDVEQLEGDRPG